jgi:hypothetical protein
MNRWTEDSTGALSVGNGMESRLLVLLYPPWGDMVLLMSEALPSQHAAEKSGTLSRATPYFSCTLPLALAAIHPPQQVWGKVLYGA